MKAKKVKIKTRPGITDELIHDYLIHHALIENYFISGTPKLNDGTIYCLSYKNAIMILIIEDSEFNARCINYLEKNGVPRVSASNFVTDNTEYFYKIGYRNTKIRI